jgi:hypothetical protein
MGAITNAAPQSSLNGLTLIPSQPLPPPKSSGFTTSSSHYMPSVDECFQVRVRTCGIVETAVDLPPMRSDQRRAPDLTGTELKYALKVFDVGGQRWERKKWFVTATLHIQYQC